MGYINAGIVAPALNDAIQAANNVTKLQDALNQGGDVYFIGRGIAYIDASLVIGSNTRLSVDEGMTIMQAPAAGSGKSLLVNACQQRAWTTGLTLTWTAGLKMSVNWPSHGFNNGQAVWIDGTAGTTNSAFSGVFRILSITDANNFVCELRRLPDAAPAGAIQGKLADQNIIVEGGTWNYNYPAASPATDGLNGVSVLFAGVNMLKASDMTITQSYEFTFYAGGLANFDIARITVTNTNKDALKISCPAWDGKVENCNFTPNDDGFSLHASNQDGYEAFALSGGFGDSLNIKIKNIHQPQGNPTDGCAVILYSGVGYFMDQIEIDGISGLTSDTLINIKGVQGASKIGRVTIKNTEWYNSSGINGISVLAPAEGTSVTVDILEIDGFSNPQTTPATGYTPWPISVATGGIVNKLTIRNLDLELSSGTVGTNLIQLAGTVNHVTIEKSYVNGNGQGNLIQTTGTAGMVVIRDCWINNLLRCVDHEGSVGTNYYLENSYLSVPQVFTLNAGSSSSMKIKGNIFYNCYQWIVANTNTGGFQSSVFSDGNQVSGSTVWNGNGTGPLAVFGWDFQTDVTKVARVNGSFCFNTNAGAGTLGQAGLVSCLGTASGSWKLLGNPSLDY